VAGRGRFEHATFKRVWEKGFFPCFSYWGEKVRKGEAPPPKER